MFSKLITRRKIIGVLCGGLVIVLGGPIFISPAFAEGTDNEAALKERFAFLSQNGNVMCSTKFEASIASMPADAKLRGSCCAPMDEARYLQQIKGTRKYADIPEVPPDPYDIPASLAAKLMSYYELPLSHEEQAAYDYAMTHSDMEGPCCCKCWRWKAYGGLGKFLIREKHFAGQQLVDFWNIGQGCGGPTDIKMHD
jgi:hypothetical protein